MDWTANSGHKPTSWRAPAGMTRNEERDPLRLLIRGTLTVFVLVLFVASTNDRHRRQVSFAYYALGMSYSDLG